MLAWGAIVVILLGVVGLVSGLSKAAGAAGGWSHWGATTQDIMDTATVLQVRQGLDLVETELRAIVRALAARSSVRKLPMLAAAMIASAASAGMTPMRP